MLADENCAATLPGNAHLEHILRSRITRTTLMVAHLHGAEVKLQRDSSPPEIDLVALFARPG